LLLFAGVDPAEARAATREEPRERPELEVPAPALRRKGVAGGLVRRLLALLRLFD
jgi:hypothetical protein